MNFEKPRIGYRIIRRFIRGVLSILLRVKVEGLENVDQSSNVVIMSNHKNWIDPILIMAYLPPKKFTIMAEEVSKLSAGWVQKLINFAQLEFINIDRGNSRSRLRGFLQAVKLMKNGGSVLIFPEGRLNQKDDDVHAYFLGAFSLAVKTETDIQPIYLRGNEEIYLGRRINIGVGECIKVTKDMDAEELARRVHHIHTEVIKPAKPGPQPEKKRVELTNLFIDGVMEERFTDDIIIKGNEATGMFKQFNDNYREDEVAEKQAAIVSGAKKELNDKKV